MARTWPWTASAPAPKAQVTPVFLDEHDNLMAALPPTPTDPKFRRALYIMLLVVGVLAASSLIQSRTNQADLQTARKAQVTAERRVAELLEAQKQADDAAVVRSEKASKERAELAARSAALERLLISILANSNDPVLRKAFEDFAKANGIDTKVLVVPSSRTTPSPSRTTSPAPSARPSSRPTSQPTPRPTQSPPPNTTTIPLPGPLPPACVRVDGQQVCVGQVFL